MCYQVCDLVCVCVCLYDNVAMYMCAHPCTIMELTVTVI